MPNLTTAHDELFRRDVDERFSSIDLLLDHCSRCRDQSTEFWHLPQDVAVSSEMTLCPAASGEFVMNDWSFSQLCRLANVNKSTINRLSSRTASRVLMETLPSRDRPVQLLTSGEHTRSLHGVSYTRLWNADLLQVAQEVAIEFEPPQVGVNGATGLYCGEQDMFCFLIDPTGWIEIGGEAFAPGFFLWNSEVGRRTLGVQTFWFQAVCQNHIVWDAVEVIDFTRKHTANVYESLDEVRRILDSLAKKRDQRRDGFAKVLENAMRTKLGDDADEVFKELLKTGISRGTITKALDIARQQGAFTIFTLVDALTKVNGQVCFAGDRTEIDAKASRLLALAV